jgi:hypothetical protein
MWKKNLGDENLETTIPNKKYDLKNYEQMWNISTTCVAWQREMQNVQVTLNPEFSG